MVDRLHNFRPMLLIIIIAILFSCVSVQQKQSESRDAVFYNRRGIEYDSKRQYDQPISDYTKAVQLNPRDALACYDRWESLPFKERLLQILGGC
jgi:tetratricopeptide (TPR) repeat protein